MDDIRWYKTEDVVQAAAALAAAHASGALGDGDFWLAQNDFRLRDGAGVYWYLDAQSRSWFRFGGGTWHATAAPPQWLEGSDALPIGLSQPPAPPDEKDADAIAASVRGQPPTAVLASIVRDLKKGYQDGSLTAGFTAYTLARWTLYDRSGACWTVGVQSGCWYRFDGQAWQKADRAPAAGDLLRLQRPAACPTCGHALAGEAVCPQCGATVVPTLAAANDETYAAMTAFLLAGAGTIPEPVTAAWEAPGGFPAPATAAPPVAVPQTCPSCGREVTPGQQFCRACGASLAQATVSAISTCPRCQAPLKPGAGFCARCGARLTG